MRRFLDTVVRLLDLPLIGLVAAAMLGLGARWIWVGELASHFALMIFTGAIVLAPLLAALRRRRRAAAALLPLLVSGYALSPLFLPAQTGETTAANGGAAVLHVATFNANYGNRRHDDIVAWLANAELECLIGRSGLGITVNVNSGGHSRGFTLDGLSVCSCDS